MQFSALSTPLLVAMTTIGVAGAANAQAERAEVFVNSDIAVSTTWTANNTYNLQKQIYVLPGATLTIQAGTVIASTTNVGGSLAVTRGAQIFVQGTQDNPVIMTSKADVATWTGGNPKTGMWREGVNEWGNLTVMGRGYISSCVGANTPTPNANNTHPMEGLVAAFPGDPNVEYGGGNDDDDSGTITFLSIRYGGKVIGLGNELNGLSLGGIGRATDIHHVEIMNNVDDGIEIWGGTVNIKYFSIWNIGDDSLDVDQGWRGRAQFGLIVQGYSVDAAQGSGVGDNCIESDGAEGSDYQPVTTGTIYNLTVIGQPTDGDSTTAWRDNCRLQYRNCIFMDGGEEVVRFDNNGDHTCGGTGYGFNGTLDWPTTWNTAFNVFSTVNAPANPAAFYNVQTSDNLIEFKDNVFYNNTNAAAYTQAVARGVFNAGNNNVQEPATSPILSIIRAPAVLKGGKVMQRVLKLDPRPQADALTAASYATPGGFFSAANYRGAFAFGNNWLCHWTAADAFGFTVDEPWCDLGEALYGVTGNPVLAGAGPLTAGLPFSLFLKNAAPNAPSALMLGVARADLPLFGGTFIPLAVGSVPVFTNASGEVTLNSTWPAGANNVTIYWQWWVIDPAGPFGLSSSNGMSSTSP